MWTKRRAKSWLRCVFYRRPAVPSARMVSKSTTCGRSDEQSLDFDLFFTGDPLCHLREWYQKLRHVDEATSKILISMYFLQETRSVICKNGIKNYDMWTKRQAKSWLRCIFYRIPAVSSARMVSKTKTCGRSDKQNLDFDVFLTGDPRCHLREWYQKLRHVDEGTSKILTSMYFL